MLLLAIPLSSPAHADSLETRKAALDDKLALHNKSKTNYIHTLPAELLTSIGHHLADSDADVALVLAGVSRHWRALFLDDARVWSTLKLSRRRTLQKTAAYWERSKGMLVSLEMNGLSVEQAGKVLAIVHPSFDRLRTLKWAVEVGLSSADIGSELRKWSGRFSNLRQLQIEFLPTQGNQALVSVHAAEDVWTILSSPCVLDTLALCNLPAMSLNPPSSLGSVESIQHLDLSSVQLSVMPIAPSPSTLIPDFSRLLGLVPNLETLAMVGTQGPFDLRPKTVQVGPIALPSLRRLNVSKSRFVTSQPIILSTPVLERADLSQLNWQAWDALLPLDPTTGQKSTANVGHLTHLNLTRTALGEEALLDSLKLLPMLTHLQVASSSFTNKTIEALVLPANKDKDAATDGLLPALEHLDMSYSESVTGGPICRMVASRRGKARDGRGLRSLAVDGCPLIELKAVEWLMAKVDRFSCKVVLEKKKR